MKMKRIMRMLFWLVLMLSTSLAAAQDGNTDLTICCWGVEGDQSVIGSFAGEGRLDSLGVFREVTGHWYYDHNLDGETDYSMTDRSWGRSGDLAFAGDFDGDGGDGVGVYRPSVGEWYIDNDLDGRTDVSFSSWGLQGDLPVAGDFNGDGIDDVGLFRPSDGSWYYNYNMDDETDARMTIGPWGRDGDRPFSGDFDGDGVAGVGVFRPSTGEWFFDENRDGVTDHSQTDVSWGRIGDQPFTLDGGLEIPWLGVFRDNDGEWFLDETSVIAGPEPTYTVTFNIDRLRLVDGEEDATSLSSGQDEFFMLYFLTEYEDVRPVDEASRGWGVYAMQAGDEYFYTNSGPGQFLRPLTLEVSASNTFQVIVVMYESEDDDAARRIIRQVTDGDQIHIDNFPDRLEDGVMENSLRNDDLVFLIAAEGLAELANRVGGPRDFLGAVGTTQFEAASVAGSRSGEFVVTGINLGDAYDYRLEYIITVEQAE